MNRVREPKSGAADHTKMFEENQFGIPILKLPFGLQFPRLVVITRPGDPPPLPHRNLTWLEWFEEAGIQMSRRPIFNIAWMLLSLAITCYGVAKSPMFTAAALIRPSPNIDAAVVESLFLMIAGCLIVIQPFVIYYAIVHAYRGTAAKRALIKSQ